jgi:hypothetical protein
MMIDLMTSPAIADAPDADAWTDPSQLRLPLPNGNGRAGVTLAEAAPARAAPPAWRGADNERIADTLGRVADLLEAQGASPFRVRAYRRAADTVRSFDEPAARLLRDGGLDALRAIPGLGPGLATSIAEIIDTGRLGLLDRLEGVVSPEDLFTTVPGIGEELAHRVHAELGIDTLEALELAAHDGRLERVSGFGRRRAESVRAVLAARLSRSARRRSRRIRTREGPGALAPVPPPVEVLLDVDREYRRGAAAGRLRTIAPRRFNPRGESWLPVLHTERGEWSFHVLFSNTGLAHRLGRTRDWVVIFFERDGDEDQVTVVTETRGELAGRRVVRGRELECHAWYRSRGRPTAAFSNPSHERKLPCPRSPRSSKSSPSRTRAGMTP